MSHEQNEGTPERPNSQNTETRKRRTPGVKSAYLWGAVSGVAFAVFAPMLRPAAKSVVKSGIKMGRYAKKVGSNLKEEFEDITAEAQADLDRDNPEAEPPREA